MKNKNPFTILGRSKDEQYGYGGGEATCGGGEATCGGSHPGMPPSGQPRSPDEISEAAPTIAGLPPGEVGVVPQSLDMTGLAEAMAKMVPTSGTVAAVAPGSTGDQPQRRDKNNYLDEMGSTWR
jgi:hypothetical protein